MSGFLEGFSAVLCLSKDSSQEVKVWKMNLPAVGVYNINHAMSRVRYLLVFRNYIVFALSV